MYYNIFSQWDGKMIIPIMEFQAYIEKMAENFCCFIKQNRQTRQFKRFLTGFRIANEHSMVCMNRMFIYHMKKQ